MSSAAATPSQNKIIYLEGLRGLAAFIVVIHHFIVGFYPALHFGDESIRHFENSNVEVYIAKSPLSILYSGNFAVCIFFVLSGFVLTKKFFETKSVTAPLMMGVKRYPRLIIPVAISSLIVYGFMKWGYIIPWYKSCFTHSGWLCSLWPVDGDWIHFLKTTFINVPLRGNQNYNTVLWTLEYEFKGSMLLVLFCLSLLLFKKIQWLPYALAFALIVFFREFYYAGFLAGAAMSQLTTQPELMTEMRAKLKKNRKALMVFLIIFTFAAAAFPVPESYAAFEFPYTLMNIPLLNPAERLEFWHTMGAISLLLIVLLSPAVQQFLSGRKLQFLGKISFSMYLLHVLLIGLATHPLAKLTMFQENWQYFFSTLLTFVAYLLVLLPLSWVFMRFVDRPAVWYAKLIEKTIMGK